MARVIIIVLIALGAALYFPRTRAPILDVSAPVLTPILRWTSQQEMKNIAEDLVVYLGSGQALPTGRGEFDAWVARRYPREDSRTDAWGKPYTLRAARDSFHVDSAGPDGVASTEDDLHQSRGLPSNARGR